MRKLAFVVLAVFGAVSVSFGAELWGSDKENYQKLKAEVEMWKGKECKYNESGELVDGDIMCDAKNVIAFFDAIKESKEYTFYKAVKKVREMPRFKNDSSIYGLTRTAGNLDQFQKSVFDEWEMTKIDLEIRGIKGEYQEAVAKESE